MNWIPLILFLLFILLVLLLVYVKSEKTKKILLIIFSYLFYASWSYKFLLILIYISFIAYLTGKIIKKHKKKTTIIFSTILIIIPLFIFKYYNFFIEEFATIFKLNISTLNIILPIGISFYTLQAISYIADIYYNKIENKKLLDVLLYIGFFPQIVSGPIVKARDFFEQLKNPISIKTSNISYGLQRVMIGVLKKFVIADRLGAAVDTIYGAYGAFSGPTLFFAMITYSIQIYYDFAGYSDIAIGIARILGFRINENFKLPYLSKSPSEFWRRWHISLSTWFKEYVYIPLGGNKKGKIRTYCNLMIVMLLSGLWHGAGLAFIIWGFLHGILLIINKIDIIFLNKTQKEKNKISNIFSMIANYLAVTALWVPFRVTDLQDIKEIFTKIITNGKGINYFNTYAILFITAITITEIVKKKINKEEWKPLDLSKFSNKIIFTTFVLLTFMFIYQGNTAFIYSQF